MKYLTLPAFMILMFGIKGNEKLVGRWESPVSPNGNITGVIFKADSSFEGYVNNKPFVTGTYSLKDDTFTFVDNGCDGKQGTYEMTFFSNGDSIRFASIEDGCEDRKNGMNRLVLGRKK